MVRASRLEVIGATLEQGVVPIFNTQDAGTGVRILDACAEAGVRVVEYTNRGDRALSVFRVLAEHVRAHRPGLILGAGTILDAPTGAIFMAEGAEFIVAPTLSREVAELCNRRRIAYLPGAFTATEVSDAEALGCELIKLFPQAAVDGPAWLRSVLGPLPWARIIPTGCPSDGETIRRWFAAGAAGIGIGSDILTPERLSSGDWAGVREALAAALAEARAARRPA